MKGKRVRDEIVRRANDRARETKRKRATETMYGAERNVIERQHLEAQRVEFSRPGGQAWAREELLFDEVASRLHGK